MGIFNWFQPPQLQLPQYQQQQFSNDQIFQTAKNADQAMRDAYKNELLAQLRAGTYKDPQSVYSNVLNSQAQQKQMDAYNQEVADAQAAQQAADQQQNQGWGG